MAGSESNSEKEKNSIEPGHAVVFFPTAGALVEGEWRVWIHGWIYTPAERSRMRRLALAVVKRILRRRIPQDHPGMPLFDRRAAAFLADNRRNVRLEVRIGEDVLRLKRSRADGHFLSAVKISREAVEAAAARSDAGWLDFTTLAPECTPEPCAGRVMLLAPTGLSVISDIDDTLKVTEVSQRRAMLRNTFLKDFASVPDMAALYRYWQTAHRAAFHYVSASPWHLYPFLAEFLREKQFPEGTFHLRDFRLVPGHIARSMLPGKQVKARHIRELLRRYPDRRFILVGDSGQADAETYGRLFRDFPGQIQKICIRNITEEEADHARWEKAFASLPSERWQVFTHPEELV